VNNDFFLKGELEHRLVKSRYKRADKRDTGRSLAKIEQRQLNMQTINARIQSDTEPTEMDEEMEIEEHFKVSRIRRAGQRIHIGTWVADNYGDPALKVCLLSLFHARHK